MRIQRRKLGYRRPLLAGLAGLLLFMAIASPASAQCAYPALELLEFDYVKAPHTTQDRGDAAAPQNVCLTVPMRETGKQEIHTSPILYEFEARLLVFQTLLRWLHLAPAEAGPASPLPR